MENYRNGEINYINMYGNKKEAYKVHVERMERAGKPSVSYQGFCDRLRKRWSVYDAIYTPATLNKVHRKPKIQTPKPKRRWWQILIDYFR